MRRTPNLSKTLHMFIVASFGRAMVLVNFQCMDVLLIWIILGQGPTVLAVGAGRCCLNIFFSLAFHVSFLFVSARRLVIDLTTV